MSKTIDRAPLYRAIFRIRSLRCIPSSNHSGSTTSETQTLSSSFEEVSMASSSQILLNEYLRTNQWEKAIQTVTPLRFTLKNLKLIDKTFFTIIAQSMTSSESVYRNILRLGGANVPLFFGHLSTTTTTITSSTAYRYWVLFMCCKPYRPTRHDGECMSPLYRAAYAVNPQRIMKQWTSDVAEARLMGDVANYISYRTALITYIGGTLQQLDVMREMIVGCVQPELSSNVISESIERRIEHNVLEHFMATDNDCFHVSLLVLAALRSKHSPQDYYNIVKKWLDDALQRPNVIHLVNAFLEANILPTPFPNEMSALCFESTVPFIPLQEAVQQQQIILVDYSGFVLGIEGIQQQHQQRILLIPCCVIRSVSRQANNVNNNITDTAVVQRAQHRLQSLCDSASPTNNVIGLTVEADLMAIQYHSTCEFNQQKVTHDTIVVALARYMVDKYFQGVSSSVTIYTKSSSVRQMARRVGIP
eukprot:PhF_6_TR12625/c0_g1_i2/m.19970